MLDGLDNARDEMKEAKVNFHIYFLWLDILLHFIYKIVNYVKIPS